jgi:hypothetical protein
LNLQKGCLGTLANYYLSAIGRAVPTLLMQIPAAISAKTGVDFLISYVVTLVALQAAFVATTLFVVFRIWPRSSILQATAAATKAAAACCAEILLDGPRHLAQAAHSPASAFDCCRQHHGPATAQARCCQPALDPRRGNRDLLPRLRLSRLFHAPVCDRAGARRPRQERGPDPDAVRADTRRGDAFPRGVRSFPPYARARPGHPAAADRIPATALVQQERDALQRTARLVPFLLARSIARHAELSLSSDRDLVLPKLAVAPDVLMVSDISDNPSRLPNDCIAAFYGKRRVVAAGR